MRMIYTARRAALAGATAMLVTAMAAGAAQAAVLHGIVVHRNTRAHSYVVADRAGRLFAIHAARSPRLASVVVVAVRPLRDGTYAGGRTRALAYRRGARVRLRGVVSFVDRRRGTFTLSARGVSMLVRTGTGSGARIAEGTVLAVDTTAATITVSSTDDDQGMGSVLVSVPSTLDISMFSVGEEVELQVSLNPDGSYVLSASSSDANAQDANNQGDQRGGQGDQQGGSGSPLRKPLARRPSRL